MRPDVLDLQAFYASRQGQLVRRLVGRQIRRLWPKVCGARILGIGYATPFLGPLLDDAERVCVMMPAGPGGGALAGGRRQSYRARQRGRAAAGRPQHRSRAHGALPGVVRAGRTPAARGLAGPGGWRPGHDRRAQPTWSVVPEREHAVRLRRAVQRGPTQGRVAQHAVRTARKCDGAVRPAAALASGPAHRARLGKGGPSVGAALRRRVVDGRREADLCRAARARGGQTPEARVCAGAAGPRGRRAGPGAD